jgi:hypothetical protein
LRAILSTLGTGVEAVVPLRGVSILTKEYEKKTMESCCNHKTEALSVLRDRQKGVLQLVLAINAVMFVAEGTAGLLAHSTALLADSSTCWEMLSSTG